MFAFFNLASILLGFTAWGLAIAAILSRRPWLSYGSFACCSISLVSQFCEIRHRSQIGDFSAIDDTIEGILFCALVLLGVTLVLNALALRNG